VLLCVVKFSAVTKIKECVHCVRVCLGVCVCVCVCGYLRKEIVQSDAIVRQEKWQMNQRFWYSTDRQDNKMDNCNSV